MSDSPYFPGARIISRAHRCGEIHVDIVGSKTLIGRVIKKDGTPSQQEVVVSIADVTEIWPRLPGLEI